LNPNSQTLKARNLFIIIALIILVDQVLKFYIKLSFIPGEERPIIGHWFNLHFVENEGMAWGWKFGGNVGKIILTLFRLIAVVWGTFLLMDFVKKGYHKGFIVCAGMIYAGALGNLLDSLFYGLIFDISYNPMTYEGGHMVAKAFAGHGYGSFLHGKVVDMLYFPLINTTLPSWIPIWGNQQFEFFQPVFNIADASISIGVISILVFQNRFFNKHSLIESKKTD